MRFREQNWDAGRLLGCREENWDAGRPSRFREETWDAGRTLGCREDIGMQGGHWDEGQKMGLQGAVMTLPLLQGRGGSCFIQEPSKAATGSVLGATSASDTATPRPSEPDPDPAPPSPLCHFGRLWFQAHGEVAAKALNRCQGRRAGRRHTLCTLPTPRSCPTRGFSSHPSTSPSGWGAPGTPRFLQQPRATGFGTRKGPGKLQVSSTAPKRLPSELAGWEK